MARTGGRPNRRVPEPAGEASAGGPAAGAGGSIPTAATAGRSSSLDGSRYTAGRRRNCTSARVRGTTRSPMPRPARPEDMYALRIATDPRLSPDGDWVAFSVQASAPRRDGYRHALWLVPADGSAVARQLTIGVKRDRHPRFAPDGESLAFISDRRLVVEEAPGAPDDREDGAQ